MNARNKEDADNLKRLEEENAKLDEKNAKIDLENKELDKNIIMMVQRIEVNHLLNEVDIEDIKMVAQNTNEMNMQFMQMMTKWETIKKSAEERVVQVMEVKNF